jgi:hypothetical protein
MFGLSQNWKIRNVRIPYFKLYFLLFVVQFRYILLETSSDLLLFPFRGNQCIHSVSIANLSFYQNTVSLFRSFETCP